jgi:hypothetical protein
MVKINGGDGSSFENAIILSECNDTEGVKQEYREVQKRFGTYKLIRQSLLCENNRMYDLLELDINGEKIKLYFDNNDFFGKWEQFEVEFYDR